MTEPDAAPSPFRRFPWMQLVFCLACLAMTARTWMRYSYAWELTPEGPGSFRARWQNGAIWRPALVDPAGWPSGSFVRITEKICKRRLLSEPLAMVTISDHERDRFQVHATKLFCPDEELTYWAREHSPERGATPRYYYGRLVPSPPGRIILRSRDHIFGLSEGTPVILADSSRFHPVSIAGLVVGAMGCFIFGLYLRKWLMGRN